MAIHFNHTILSAHDSKRIDRHGAPSLDRYFIAREFTRAAKVFEGNN